MRQDLSISNMEQARLMTQLVTESARSRRRGPRAPRIDDPEVSAQRTKDISDTRDRMDPGEYGNDYEAAQDSQDAANARATEHGYMDNLQGAGDSHHPRRNHTSGNDPMDSKRKGNRITKGGKMHRTDVGATKRQMSERQPHKSGYSEDGEDPDYKISEDLLEIAVNLTQYATEVDEALVAHDEDAYYGILSEIQDLCHDLKATIDNVM